MAEDQYWLLGKVNIPTEKKKEFNENVLEVLNRCGMRKRVNITLAGKNITVLEQPHPDANGIVTFDYSIFEKKNRGVSAFDMNTGVLTVADRGMGEFGLTINLILLLQECYSNGSCFFMKNRKPVWVSYYMDMLCTILDKRICNTGRSKVWDMIQLIRTNPDCDMLKVSEVFDIIPYDHIILDSFQVISLIDADMGEAPKEKENPITDRSQISEAKFLAKKRYLYLLMEKMQKLDDEGLEAYLKKLLKLPLPEREKLAKTDDDFGILAECSLYIPPASFICFLALLRKKKFWDIWDAICGEGYKDTLEEEKSPGSLEPWKPYHFYKQIQRENQDEFLEFWDGDNLVLSDDMKKRIREWKELFERTEDETDLPVEEYLADILVDMEHDWNLRYINKKYVDEVLKNKNIAAWRRSLLVLRKTIDDGIELFPELDRKMAVMWLKTFRMTSDVKATAAFCSLIENETQRTRIFGF